MHELYCTTYCNHAHIVKDGRPVNHECYVLPPKVLKAEMEGDMQEAINLLCAAGRLKHHRGVKMEVF